jgi:hypothetical protein
MGQFNFYKGAAFQIIGLALLLVACNRETIQPNDLPRIKEPTAFQGVIQVGQGAIEVDLVIDKPALPKVDVLLLFHGTVSYDSLILAAATNTLTVFKNLTDRNNILFVSVAYPEENLLMGDNVLHAEAALLWVKNQAAVQLGVEIDRVFLAGHSQGGYLAVRLNHLYETDGVVANAPGPLNLILRCDLEERGLVPSSGVCESIRGLFGPTSTHPWAYHSRSLLAFTAIQKSRMLLVQGLNDSPIQMQSWPVFKQALQACTACAEVDVLEVSGVGHAALFENLAARIAFNAFIAP